MRPSEFIKYWSEIPLDREEFLNIIEKNYRFKNGTLNELKVFLNEFSNSKPFIIDWRQSDIDEDRIGYEPRYSIEYLVYIPLDLAPWHGNHIFNWNNSIIRGLARNLYTTTLNDARLQIFEDWYRNRRIPSDMEESERKMISRLISHMGWNAISNYGDGGLEIEYEYTERYHGRDNSGYIQLEYTGPGIWAALNYPRGNILGLDMESGRY